MRNPDLDELLANNLEREGFVKADHIGPRMENDFFDFVFPRGINGFFHNPASESFALPIRINNDLTDFPGRAMRNHDQSSDNPIIPERNEMTLRFLLFQILRRKGQTLWRAQDWLPQRDPGGILRSFRFDPAKLRQISGRGRILRNDRAPS